MNMFRGRIARLAGLFLLALALGCGKAHVNVVNNPANLGDISEIYVAPADVSSLETYQHALDLNREFAALLTDELVAGLSEMPEYRVVEDPDASPGAFVAKPTLRIRYGNRAQRYFGGSHEGRGVVTGTIDLEDPSSGEVRLAVQSESTLKVGAFGGGMGGVIRKNIRKLVDEFLAKLQ